MADRNKIIEELGMAVFLGIVSGLLALVQFNVPDFDKNITNLGEIPLLISVLYLRNPLSMLISIGIAFLISIPLDIMSLFWGILSHFVALLPLWYFYQKIFRSKFNLPVWKNSLISFLAVVAYYIFLLVPLILLQNFNLLEGGLSVFQLYQELIYGFAFEILATALCFSLFVQLFNSNTKLKAHIDEVELTVKKRTLELDRTIKKLHGTNIELKSLNDHLDELVLTRTRELESRNLQLTGYAFVNSHLLRAPLARVLGLSYIIEKQAENIDDKQLIDKFLFACNELDQIIKLLSKFLSEDNLMDESRHTELQEKIRKLSLEFVNKQKI